MTAATTIGELRASGYPDRTVKEELRDNLLRRLGGGEDLFPSLIGFDDSVLPALERGILATVREDDELLVAVRGGVNHCLGENVNVGDRTGLHLAGRLNLPASDLDRG